MSPTLILLLSSLIPAADLDLRDGDRVAWLGGTLIEREQRYGYWELALTLRHPDRNVTFRNLGWSGDTVWGESRVSFDFDKPGEGVRRIVEQVRAVKPTVLILGYGANESFAGESGLPRFRSGLNALLDALAPFQARMHLLAPLPLERLPPPLPDPTAANRNIGLYRDAIREIAAQRKAVFLDLLERLPGRPKEPLTDNGMHLTENGYRQTARAWLDPVPDDARAEALRQAIVEKNRLFFHRWRPQNETYLFGFRKHEQGQNAREIPRFDPLVAELEARIARLRRPEPSGKPAR